MPEIPAAIQRGQTMYIRDDCPLPPGSSIYAYLRVSGEDQAERGTPIAGQRQELER